MWFHTTCVGCGLDVHDLPNELGDREAVREQFFTFDDGGELWCNHCYSAGYGVFNFSGGPRRQHD